jgi:hypothetical protein
MKNKKKKLPITETEEIRKMRVEASFGKFKPKVWNGKKNNKQKRQNWNQKGIHDV